MDTIVEVRRLLASIVLSVIGFLPVAGALSDVTRHVSQLPPCCRAHGKHKCAMRLLQYATSSSPVEPGIYPVCSQYPFLPPASLAPANASVFPPKDSELFRAAIASQPAAQFEDEARYSGCFGRSHLKRGPPTFLS